MDMFSSVSQDIDAYTIFIEDYNSQDVNEKNGATNKSFGCASIPSPT